MNTSTNPTKTTADGTEYIDGDGSVVLPTDDHDAVEGITLTEEAADAIITGINLSDKSGDMAGISGDADYRTSWELTGGSIETRIGPSREIILTQTIGEVETTTTVSMVDVADLELKARGSN